MSDQDTIERLRQELASAKDQLRAYEAIEAGDIPAALTWLQTKAWRQGKALDRLNQRVVNQRAVLGTMNRLGRDLSTEEWAQLRLWYPRADQEVAALLLQSA